MGPVTLTLAAVAGVALYRNMKRGKRHGVWRTALEEAATKLGGRASPGTRFDTPQLRAAVDGIDVTVTVKQAHKSDAHGVAIAETPLAEATRNIRLYFGWDVGSIREEIEHFPEVEGFIPLEGRTHLRSDHPEVARAFVSHAAKDFSDVRREANAHAVEVLIRGGTLRLAVHGVEQSSWMIERIVTATSRLTRGLEYFAGAPENARHVVTSAPDDNPRCELCTERRQEGTPWIACARCGATYHQTCWVQATGCLVTGCEETRSRAL